MTNPKGSKYRKKEDLKRFFYPSEWLSFYNSLSEKLKFYFNVLMQTGTRYNEIKHVEIRDIDFDRHLIKIRHAKTRIGGMKKIKVTCENCHCKVNLSKVLKFCPLCGNEFKDISNLMDIYKDKILKRRRDIRNVKISGVFAGELKTYVNMHNLKFNDTLKFPTIQHLNQTMKFKIKKQGIKDWQDFSPHTVRKTHENYLLATGSNPLSLRMHIGHSIDVAVAHYISTNIFTQEEIGMIKMILNNLTI